MELYLNHVGIIKESNIILDGLTVITGKIVPEKLQLVKLCTLCLVQEVIWLRRLRNPKECTFVLS